MKKLCLCISCLILLTVAPGFAGEPPRRIVSLAPSLTELACALGLEKNLVGVTTFCDRPASVKGKPTVGGPANPSLEAVLNLKPDVVLVDEEGIGSKLAKRLQKLGSELSPSTVPAWKSLHRLSGNWVVILGYNNRQTSWPAGLSSP